MQSIIFLAIPYIIFGKFSFILEIDNLFHVSYY